MRRVLTFSTVAIVALAAVSLAADSRTAPVSAKPAIAPGATLEKAVFGGGCFWCMEGPFEKLDGVSEVRSGYAGGITKNPTYEEVSSGHSGHVEVVEVVYDPAKISYEKLLDTFWVNVDPTREDAQFCDRGEQYRSAIFPASDAQRAAAEKSLAELSKTKPFDAPIVTRVESFDAFWPAEEYHQDYYKKNPLKYRYYRGGCGRDRRLKELWGDRAGHI